MTKKVITDGEQQENYLEWDDATLGRGVKAIAKSIEDKKGDKALACTACATLLACMAAEQNAEISVFNLSGVRDGGKQVGDWKITVRNMASKVVGRIPKL